MTGYQFQRLRVRLFAIIEKDANNDLLSRLYDGFMLVTIIVSLIPLTSKNWTDTSVIIDWATSILFMIDYAMRWATADLLAQSRGGKHAKDRMRAFLFYPLTAMAVIDLLSILPTITSVLPIANAAGTLRVLRVTRAVRCMRVFKFLRYSDQFSRILRVFRKEQKVLYAVLGLAAAYILVCAIMMFSLEPTNFSTFFDAVYWASSTLTTVGYGDVYPVTSNGRLFSMFAALFGIAVVALPSGIITAAFLEDFNRNLTEQTRKGKLHDEMLDRELQALELEMKRMHDEIESRRG